MNQEQQKLKRVFKYVKMSRRNIPESGYLIVEIEGNEERFLDVEKNLDGAREHVSRLNRIHNSTKQDNNQSLGKVNINK